MNLIAVICLISLSLAGCASHDVPTNSGSTGPACPSGTHAVKPKPPFTGGGTVCKPYGSAMDDDDAE